MVKKIGEKMCEEIFSVQMLIKLNPRIW
jgi:hypothetical protein